MHEYKLEKAYTDASGLRYEGLEDSNRLIGYIPVIEDFMEIHNQTGITDIYELGRLTDTLSEVVEKIATTKKIYEKCLVKQK